MIVERRFPEYPGHFDDRSIVPGAALLGWVQACVPGLSHLDRVRFIAPVIPGEVVRLEIDFDGVALTFAIVAPDGVRVRGKGRKSTPGTS